MKNDVPSAIIALLIILSILSGCTPCNPNHSGACEGPPITPAEQEEARDILDSLKARADTSNIIGR